LGESHGFDHGFPLIRSLRASAQRSTSVLFSFVLSLLIVAGPFAIVDQKRFWRDPVKRIGAAFRGRQTWTCAATFDYVFSNLNRRLRAGGDYPNRVSRSQF
jgi:hypothetical protein